MKKQRVDTISFLLKELQDIHPDLSIMKIIDKAIKLKYASRSGYVVNYTDASLLAALKLYYVRSDK